MTFTKNLSGQTIYQCVDSMARTYPKAPLLIGFRKVKSSMVGACKRYGTF